MVYLANTFVLSDIEECKHMGLLVTVHSIYDENILFCGKCAAAVNALAKLHKKKPVVFVCFQDNLVCFFDTLCSTNSVFFWGEGIGIGHLSDSSQFLGEIVKGSLLLIKR